MSPTPGSACIDGGGGRLTHLFCGFFGSEEVPNPLIANLPRVLKLGIREAASRELIEASVRFVAAELVAGRLASSDVVSRLCELLLVAAFEIMPQVSHIV